MKLNSELMSDGLMWKIQLIQNAATRIITGARQCDHITHVLHQLHWLPVWQWVNYKIACMVHQSLSHLALAYFSLTAATAFSDLQLTKLTWRVVPCTHNTFGDRSIAPADSQVWNSLPSQLRQDISYRQFKQQVKTFLFGHLRWKFV